MNRLFFVAAFLLGLLLSGCAQKITVKALQPAEFDRAASVKTVGVAPFAKDDVGLGPKIETRLANHRLKPGQPYFTVVSRADLDRVLAEQSFQHSGLADDGAVAGLGRLVGAQALVSGIVTAASVIDTSYTENRTRCVETDKKGKCLKSERYNVSCIKRSFSLSAQARMVAVEQGDLIAAKNLYQSSVWTHCEDGGGNGLPARKEGLDRLADQAAAEFVAAITPRYVTFQVELIDKLDVKLPAEYERRFDSALAFIKQDRLDRGGELLADLMDAARGKSAAVAYNLGVVREAEGVYAEAKKLYMHADRQSDKPVKVIGEAIKRIDSVIAKHNRALEQMAR